MKSVPVTLAAANRTPAPTAPAPTTRASAASTSTAPAPGSPAPPAPDAPRPDPTATPHPGAPATTVRAQGRSARAKLVVLVVAGICLLAIAVVGVGVGRVWVNPVDTIRTLFGNAPAESTATIVWDLRLPRIGLAIMLGANLAASGALLQSVMQNPLADPGLTGVSAGASVGVLLIILAAPAYFVFVPIAAIVGGALATVMVFAFAWQTGAGRNGGLTPIRVILAGVAVNSVFGGVTGYLSLKYSDRLPSALHWLNGSLSSKTLGDVVGLLPFAAVGWVLLITCIRPANVMRLGEDVARTLGQNLTWNRLALSGVAVYLAAISVATVGLIGFVGLVVPHIARLLVGSDARFHYPLSLILGGVVLLAADTLGRSAFGMEIPAGIVMAVVGGPYFLYLMRRRQT